MWKEVKTEHSKVEQRFCPRSAELKPQLGRILIILFVMSKIQAILVFLTLVGLMSSQIVDLNLIFTADTQATLGPEYKDPAFLTLINNYFGCKTWTNGFCTACSPSYVFNKAGICCLVDQQCEKFNTAMGVCEQCYTGYYISSNGSCLQSDITTPAFVGCAEWAPNNVCKKCSVKYYFGADNTCVQVNDYCRLWNISTGACTDCYLGYVVANNSCVLNPVGLPLAPEVAGNPLCHQWNGSVCLSCATRSFFDANRICQLVNDHCWTFDPLNGVCLTCYKGYDLVDNICVYSPSNNAAVTDPGCGIWNGAVCLSCSQWFVFNAKGVCIPVSGQCRTYDNATGNCLTCYRGYDLENGSCNFSPSNTAPVSDPGCSLWNGTVCLSCSKNWVFNSNGICVTVHDTCRTFDASGVCTGCYLGYSVVNGSCTVSVIGLVPDAGCKIWDFTTNSCNTCSAWFFYNTTSKLCLPVSNLCHTFDPSNGWCLTCYNGYTLNSGVCIIQPSHGQGPNDLGCAVWNGSVCLTCSFNWVFNNNGVCIVVSDQCRTHDNNGNCLTCYVGYSLNNGLCTYTPEAQATGGCNIWNWSNKTCSKCSINWVFDTNGNCVPVSDDCRTHDDKGACTSCYRGYDLVNKLVNDVIVGVQCVYSPSNTVGPKDVGCKLWDWNNSVCLQCSDHWFFDSNKVCLQVSSLCKSSDAATGLCLSCYVGYDLINGACVFSPLNTAHPTDVGCKIWNGSVCLECSFNWYFNSNKVCVPTSDQCKTSDGPVCTSCFLGYVLVNGTCQLSALNSAVPTDAGCSDWDWWGQVCKKCSNWWYFSNGICIPVNALCRTYDATNGACLTCYTGYALNNGTCVIVPYKVVGDTGCTVWNFESSTCTQCAPYWYSKNGVCATVSPFCKTYDNSTGLCTSCFGGYANTNGTCTVLITQCKTGDSTGCLSCYNGYALYRSQCIALNNIANIALYYAECCPEKLAQLKADGRIPQ